MEARVFCSEYRKVILLYSWELVEACNSLGDDTFIFYVLHVYLFFWNLDLFP